MIERVETVIVGGGQAGLATSYWLRQQGREHLILEQDAQPASAWRHGRWDSFTLVIPNWAIRLPGAEYEGDDPDGFMSRDEIVAYLEMYAGRFKLPLRYNVRAVSVEPSGGGYLVRTAGRSGGAPIEAANVVIATGSYQEPSVPDIAGHFPPNIAQLHSSEYRNPHALASGAVLVVGAGQSGCQIAEELYQSGWKVYLSVGRAPHLPRRYRGRDIVWWADRSGFFDRPADRLRSQGARFAANPQLTGRDGGHTINLHQFAA